VPNPYGIINYYETRSIQNLLSGFAERLSWSREDIKNEQETALKALLQHAKHNSSYYSKKLAHIVPEQFTLRDLSSLPIINKKEVMTHWDEIVTDKNLNLEGASQFLMQQSHPSLFKDAYHITATGGSSGIRGLFSWNIEEFITFVAAFFRYQYRDNIGDADKPWLTAAITAHKPVHLSRFVFTIPITPKMEMLRLPATLPISDMIAILNKKQPTHLVGYTTEIYRLAQEACRGKLNIFPQRVSVNSEPLFPEMLETIKRAWNVPVTNMWGSSDVGPHAQSCDQSDDLHLNEDLMIFEPVDENYQPVAEGEKASKVLITNLFHYSFPLFRYEMDDHITILNTPCPCGSSFKLVQSIQGRNDDSFMYANNICVIPEVFENIIFPEQFVDEHQVFQTEKGATITLVTSGEIQLEKLQTALIKAFKSLGVENPQIEINIVAQLQRHSETGKLKRFVKLMS
jgi:phenylacetate-CoA ligase